MANDACRKISRGQVWFLVDKDVPLVHTQGSVQGKNRPWLIISNNTCNQSSTVYTVVPLTTAAKPPLPVHVTFTTGDKQQTIECEQIRTVSEQVFRNPGSSYMWTMSEKYMKLVDEALACQLGLQIIFPNSDRYWESLEKLIRVRVKQAIEHSKVDAIDITKVASLLDARVESIVNETVNPLPVQPEHEQTVEEIVEETTEELPLEPKRDFVPYTPQKRRTWTIEQKKDFLKFYEEFGAAKTAEHYKMKIGTVHTDRFNFFKQINGGNNNV